MVKVQGFRGPRFNVQRLWDSRVQTHFGGETLTPGFTFFPFADM